MNKKLLKLHIENATPIKYTLHDIIKLNAEILLFLMFCVYLFVIYIIWA